MLNWTSLFSGSNLFMPHGHCYLWKPELVGLHVLSDALIALAYYSMPLTLFYFVRRRSDLPSIWLFWLFSAFTVACGTTHLLEIWTLWYPAYWLSGSVKLLTAMVSVTTAVLLVPIVPQALAQPSLTALALANEALQQEVAERKRIEAELRCNRALREAIFNEAADALFLVDPQTLLTLDCNQRAVDLFQAVDHAHLIGIEGRTLQRYQFSQGELQEIGAEMQAKGFWSREIEYVTCQGNVFWGNLAAKPITVAERVMNLVRVTDITDRKQAELAVSRLAAIVEFSGDAIIGKSLDGTITSWNAGAERLFGYTAAEVIDRPIALLYPPDHTEELAQVLEQIKHGNIIERYETIRVRKDGQRLEITATISPIKDATGRVIGAAKIARDVTAQKQAEVSLRESENRFHAFMDNSPAASWITDAAGRMLYRSQNYSRLLQIPQDAVGKTIFDLFTPEIAEEFHRNNRQVAETNQALEVIEVALRADGTLGKFLVYKFPLWEPSRECSVGGIAVDITEREQAKEELRSLSDRLQYLLAHAPVAIFSCKTSGDYRATWMSENARAILGYQPREFLADSNFWTTHIHPEDRDRILANSSQLFATEQHTHEYRFLHGDGEYRWFYEQLQLMRDTAGNPTEIIGYLMDISDRKRAEQALQEREAFLRAIGDNLPNSFLYQTIREPDGRYRFTYLSAGVERVTGLKPAAIVADASLLYNLLFEDDLSYMAQQIEASAQNLSVFDVQVRERLPSGEIRWVRLCSTPRRLEDGQIAWDGIRLDINDLKQTEATLCQSEAKNRALIQALPDLLIRMKQDGTYLDVHKSENVKLLNSSLVTANSNLYTILPADKAQERMTYVEKALQTRELQVYEYQLSVDGKLQFEEARIIPCGADEVLVIVRDISEAKRAEVVRKQAEAALRDSERRFRAIFNTMFQFIGLLTPEGILLEANQAALEAAGLMPEDVINRPFWEVRWWTISAATQAQLKAAIAEAATGQFVRYEVEVLGVGGRVTTIDFSLKPIQDEAGRVVLLIPEGRDISKAKQSEVELELQSIIVSNMAEGVCMVKVSNNMFVYTNPKFERMFGYDADELIGQHVAIVNYADAETTPVATHQAIATTILQQGEATYEVYNVKKDGTPFWGQGTASLFEHPTYGTVLVAVHQDVTERKQAEADIQASLQEKEVLLKEIHHRVKNNLGVVDGLLQMQARRSQNPEVIETLKESHNRIASIALVHEKLYSSEDLAKINIAHYIADLTAHLFDSYNIHANQVKLMTHINAIPLAIDTAIPCGLIINELVSNALKYAFSNGQVGEIQVILDEQQDQSLCLIVQDNGVGFPQDFDLKQTTTLGLSLIQGLVKQLQGTLAIHSQSGTSVTVTFPRGQ